MEIGESRDIVTLDSQRLMHVARIFFYSATEWKTLEVRENPLFLNIRSMPEPIGSLWKC